MTTDSAKSHCQSNTNRPFSIFLEGGKVLVGGRNVIRKFRNSLSNISKYTIPESEFAEEEVQNMSFTVESTSKLIILYCEMEMILK